ncbi:MAG: hypothetical protein GY699_08910 [Desulfobacteraceae bacterium]|nr:hypothetical protein [Desulfobacteraceae bacterium]
MLKIKKYANGRFFDTINKKYIKPDQLAEIIKKGEKIQVTLTKTGKDITSTVIAQLSKKEAVKKEKKAKTKKKKDIPFLKTDKLVKWVGDIIDSKISKVLEAVKLPSREQVTRLDENIKALNKKIDALKLAQEKGSKKKATAAAKKAAPKVEKPATSKVNDVNKKKANA